MATISPLEVTPAHHLSQSSQADAGETPMQHIEIPRGDVVTTLNFYNPPEDGSDPFNYVEEAPEGEPKRNFGDFTTSVTIHDVRGRENQYNLDGDAFAVIQGVTDSAEKEFISDESIVRNYYPEVEKLLL